MSTRFQKKICPFVQNPFSECYCVTMGSQDIEKAIYYCSKHFKMCEFYNAKSFGDVAFVV
ncbi:MAG: hypothetical protein HY808_16630 [Nitrospirae bacterium]|nr:hypothetical protein [Nitrospirota bacterium]